MNVAVIGASNKPERYSYKAVKLLQEKGHTVFPVHKRIKDIDGLTVYESLADIKDPVDTVTLYVSADISSQMADEIANAKPKRIIFNPGAENPALRETLEQHSIRCLNACTLVLLNTSQF